MRDMLGWMIIFGIFSLLGGFLTAAADPAIPSTSIKLATILFTSLFVVSLLTRVVRGRT
jgi:uncharacterized membrane protein YtjA (UPF0391 family)